MQHHSSDAGFPADRAERYETCGRIHRHLADGSGDGRTQEVDDPVRRKAREAITYVLLEMRHSLGWCLCPWVAAWGREVLDCGRPCRCHEVDLVFLDLICGREANHMPPPLPTFPERPPRPTGPEPNRGACDEETPPCTTTAMMLVGVRGRLDSDRKLTMLGGANLFVDRK